MQSTTNTSKRVGLKFYQGVDSAVPAIMRWHIGLHGTGAEGPNMSRERARLRRCVTLEAVLTESEFYELLRRVAGAEPDLASAESKGEKLSRTPALFEDSLQALAAIAHLLAFVPPRVRTTESDEKTKKGVSLGAALRGKSGDGAAAVSDTRFRRILATQTVDELIAPLRRALVQVNGQVSASSLIATVGTWRPSSMVRTTHEDPRIALARDYYS